MTLWARVCRHCPEVCEGAVGQGRSLTCPDDLGDDVEVTLHVLVAQVLQRHTNQHTHTRERTLLKGHNHYIYIDKYKSITQLSEIKVYSNGFGT